MTLLEQLDRFAWFLSDLSDYSGYLFLSKLNWTSFRHSLYLLGPGEILNELQTIDQIPNYNIQVRI
jgi:hypothetical protein